MVATTDPYDPGNRGAIYISAKRGLGLRVVAGQRLAEQVLYSPRAGAVRVLTRSGEDSLLRLDRRGGLREVPLTGGRAVLTDALVRRLARAAQLIRRVFGGREQDIEWLYRGGRLYVVQSRPYVAGASG